MLPLAFISDVFFFVSTRPWLHELSQPSRRPYRPAMEDCFNPATQSCRCRSRLLVSSPAGGAIAIIALLPLEPGPG